MGVRSYIVNQKPVFLSKQSVDFLPSKAPKPTNKVFCDMRAMDMTEQQCSYRVCCSFSLDTIFRSGE